MSRRSTLILCLIVIAAVSGLYALQRQRDAAAKPHSATESPQTPAANAKMPAAQEFDTARYSLTDPTSPWVIANKTRPLDPMTYVPADLVVPDIQLRSNITRDERQVRQATAEALQKLSAAAAAEGITLTLESGYRSYNFQVNLYNHYVNVQGKAVADTQSARPGYSEHQTGLAADIGGVTKPACNVEECFKDTPEGIWLAANAHSYGFVIRYPEGKDAVTGYIYEPWHVRYVGVELAEEVHAKNISTLEEFFKLSAAPDYN